jgi:hypothetical protein
MEGFAGCVTFADGVPDIPKSLFFSRSRYLSHHSHSFTKLYAVHTQMLPDGRRAGIKRRAGIGPVIATSHFSIFVGY